MTFIASALLYAAFVGISATVFTAVFDWLSRLMDLRRGGPFILVVLHWYAAVHVSPFSRSDCPPLGEAIAIALLAVIVQYLPTLLLQLGANLIHPASKDIRPYKKAALQVLLAVLAGQLTAFLLRLYFV